MTVLTAEMKRGRVASRSAELPHAWPRPAELLYSTLLYSTLAHTHSGMHRYMPGICPKYGEPAPLLPRPPPHESQLQTCALSFYRHRACRQICLLSHSRVIYSIHNHRLISSSCRYGYSPSLPPPVLAKPMANCALPT